MAEPSTLLLSGLALVLFLRGSEALLTGLIMASVFQAMAFTNLGQSPLIIYYFLGVVYILRNGIDFLWQPNLLQWSPGKNTPFFWLLVFIAIALVGVLVLPMIFKGVMVYSPKLSIDEQYNNLTALELSASHFNQLGQLVINGLIFSIIWLRRVSPWILLRAMLFTLGVVLFFAAWQLFANLSGVYFPDDWLYTVSGWSIGNQQAVGAFLRVNSVFLEPSTLSTYLVGVFAFLLVWWVQRPTWALFLGVFFCLLGMMVTLSTTAYVGILLVVTAVFLGFGLTQLLNGGWINKTLFAILIVTALLAWLILVMTTASGDARDLFKWILSEKGDGDSFRVRIEADLHSFEILWRTYGLGLGLGGNRPSSFLALLVSNLGVMGLLSFFLFMLSLSSLALSNVKAWTNGSMAVYAVAAVWGLWALMIAKVFSQPDLSFAPLWIWSFLLASFCTWHQDRFNLFRKSLP